MTPPRLLPLALPVLFLAACGYGLVGRGSSLPADVATVYVAPLENRTPRAQVEQILSRAIADELVTRQRLRVVSAPGEADAILGGAVTGFAVTPVTFDSAGRATEFEISITAQMEFRRPGAEEAIWRNDRYVFRENYPVELTESGYFDQELVAIEEISPKFAQTLISDLLEGF